MKFEHSETESGYDVLTTQAYGGVSVAVHFDNENPEFIALSDGEEYVEIGAGSTVSEWLRITVDHNDQAKLKSLANIIAEATHQLPGILAENRKSDAADEAMRDELLSPGRTGRV